VLARRHAMIALTQRSILHVGTSLHPLPVLARIEACSDWQWVKGYDVLVADAALHPPGGTAAP
jgi:hypothetical protein